MLRSVAALALSGTAPFELGVICEVFGIDRTNTGGPRFDFFLCGERPGPVTTSLGFAIDLPYGIEVLESVDLVAVPSFPATEILPEVVGQALRSALARGAWVLSVSTGAFALGQAGLLDGRRCTTHWMCTDELQQLFPTARVDPDVLYVEDRGVITGAGTAAGIDACLHLVRRELGAAATNAIARRMVVPPHREGGQAQYVTMPVPRESEALGPMLEWAQAHLADELRVRELAARAHLSERTFARHFRAETGTTPAAWLTGIRLAQAQELLEQTSLTVDKIARRCGFGVAAVMRHHFAQQMRTSPAAYRRTFAGRPGVARRSSPRGEAPID